MSKRMKSFELVASGEYDVDNSRFVLDKKISLDDDAIYFATIDLITNVGDIHLSQTTTMPLIKSKNHANYLSGLSITAGEGMFMFYDTYTPANDEQSSKYVLVSDEAGHLSNYAQTTIYIYRLM